MNLLWFIEPSLGERENRIGDIGRSYIISKRKPNFSDKINYGDIIRFAENGYGIYKTCKIRCSVLHKLDTMAEFNKIRVNIDPYLSEDYIRRKHKEAEKSFEDRKFIYFVIVEHEIIDLTEYVIQIQRGVQGPLHDLNKGHIEIINERPEVALMKSGFAESGKIPGKLKNECRVLFSQIPGYGILALTGHIDHIVPNSSGGPGSILENLMPLISTINIVKNDVPDKGFFNIASKWDLRTVISEEFLRDFNVSKRNRYKQLVQAITKEIWEKKVEERRLFYWKVRGEIYPNINFESAYQKAGIACHFLK